MSLANEQQHLSRPARLSLFLSHQRAKGRAKLRREGAQDGIGGCLASKVRMHGTMMKSSDGAVKQERDEAHWYTEIGAITSRRYIDRR